MTTRINSNLSNREAYAQYGKLDDARMEALFDAEDERHIEALECDLKNEQDKNEGAKEQQLKLDDDIIDMYNTA